MSLRFDAPRKPLYERIYTSHDIAVYVHRFGHPEESIDVMTEKLDRVSRLWRRTRLRVDGLLTIYDLVPCDDPEIASHVGRRRRGSVFPAIVMEDARYLPLDGNHRIRAAQCAGDEWIDAFVPCEDAGR